jgi:hypothetical protein
MQAIVHPADIQDRDGGVLLIATLFGSIPSCASCSQMVDIRGRSSNRAQVNF